MLDNTKVAQTAQIFLSEHVAPKLGHRDLTLVPERLYCIVLVCTLYYSAPLSWGHMGASGFLPLASQK